MTASKHARLGLALCGALTFAGGAAWAQRTSPRPEPPDVEALRGLSGLAVRAGRIDAALEKEGWTASRIEQDVRQKLSAARIRVLEMDEDDTTSPPFLDVSLEAFRDPAKNLYVVDLQMRLRRGGLIPRGGKSVQGGATWRRHWTGLLSGQRLDEISRQITRLMDEFIRLYYLVNEKRREP